MITTIHYIALLISFMSASLLLPAIYALGQSETEIAVRLFLYAMLGGFGSFSVLMSARGRVQDLSRISRTYLVVLGWLFLPLLVALPLSDAMMISYTDALFEAVSAVTTTAADSVANLDALPKSAIWLRSQIQWIGGLATLATFALFLRPMKIGGLPSAGAGKEHSIGIGSENTVYRGLWTIAKAYLFLTVFCFAALLICGIDPFNALILSAAAVSTGGFLPESKSVLDIVGVSGLLVVAFFLLVGATSIFSHRLLLQFRWDRLKNMTEYRSVLLVFLLLTIGLFITLVQISGATAQDGNWALFAESIFNSASLVSTSGLESRPGIYALLPPVLVITILFVGAGCYSTGGGIKHFRIETMFFHSRAELKQLIYPHRIDRTNTLETSSSLQAKMVWIMFCAALLVVSLGALSLAITGLSFEASLISSIAAFVNAGPAYSPEWVARGTQGWPAYSQMLVGQKMILSVIMIFGRLEVVALVAALNPYYWMRS